jgi:NAD(P)-dependent dehydrogenase (short-subunit alcohol dehydrogenase family)
MPLGMGGILWLRAFIRLGPGRGSPGQVALVTTRSQGIGRAMAEMPAGAGGSSVLNHKGATARIAERVSPPVLQLHVDPHRGARLLASVSQWTRLGRRY